MSVSRYLGVPLLAAFVLAFSFFILPLQPAGASDKPLETPAGSAGGQT